MSTSIKFPGTSRSNSLASTASSSGTSLSRRSRTRKRTRQTEAARPEGVLDIDNVLDISASYNEELVSAPAMSLSPENLNFHPSKGDSHCTANIDLSNGTGGTFGPAGPLIRRDQRRAETIATVVSGLVYSRNSVVNPADQPKGKARHSTLPRLTSPPSSFRPTTVEGDTIGSSVRDSLLTQQSSTSSSVYPLSTSTGTESPPSPLSPVEQDHCVAISAIDLDGPKFDADDVAYRLFLLKKNSYFLPPAHSKPSPSDFPPVISPTKRMPAPAFLDLFRVGRAKSKPSSPESSLPVVRVTSDSTTASGHVSRDHGRPAAAQSFRSSPVSQHMASMARVVVVREKVKDLEAATKQAEVDLKTHELMERAPRKAKLEILVGIVDPTDEVDVPLPSPSYPFTLQASALHGLGIEDSIGAAVLAERLPPPRSPGLSTLDPREDAWRKALLHQAVGHSLNNSAASLSPGQSTPSRSPRCPRSTESMNVRGIQHQRKMLDQKILRHPIIDPSDETDLPSTPTPAPPANPTGPPATLTPALIPDIHRLSNYAPMRAETPVPHTPLSPPPRRPLGNAQYSRSQTDLTSVKRTPGRQSQSALRKSISSPMLSDAYDTRAGGMRTPTKTPPPVPTLSLSPEPISSHRMSRLTNVSRYTSSDQGEIIHHQRSSRPSLALSMQSIEDRPSPSDYSQPSPTASAFRDRWSDGYYSAHSQLALAQPSQPPPDTSISPVSHMARFTAMSPPPRPSSSVAGIALSPAPRPGYLPFQSTPRIVQPCRSSSELSRGTFRSFPVSAVQQHTQPSTLDVNPSVLSFHSDLHSAPPPSSTAEFFDHIQGHPAMDSHYDSEDSASEGDHEITALYASSQQQPQSSLTQLGNFSTPDIRGATVPYYPTGITKDPKKPVGNVPSKSPYFTNIKASPYSLTQLSLSLHSREHLVDDESSSSLHHQVVTGDDHVRRWQRDQLAFEESSKKLDGMVVQHMQAERDRMKRIAQTSKVLMS